MQDSILREAFSLSQSAGIYFEGERVDSTSSELVLFVGLGGTGTEALIRVKNQVHNRMKLPVNQSTNIPVGEIPKNMAFLAIDTDKDDVREKKCGNIKFASGDSETIDIGNRETIVKWIGLMKNTRAPFANWLKSHNNYLGYNNPPMCSRVIGRAAFFANYDNIRNRISTTIHRLSSDNPRVSSLRIFVFSGIAGGTGSGTFIDMGYLLRDIGRSMDPRCQVYGYFFMPDTGARGGQPTGQANAYAALKELDFLMERGKELRQFKQVYTPGGDMIVGTNPYDFCHLINSTDVHGNVYTRTDVMNAVAESVFAYVANEPGLASGAITGFKSMYDNIMAHIEAYGTESPKPAHYGYISVGSSLKKIPYMEINTLIACRMFAALERDVFTNEVTDTKFDSDKSSLGLGRKKGNQMFQDGLAAIIERNVPGEHQLTKRNYSYKDIWGEHDAAYKAAYDDAQKYQTKLNENLGTAPGYLEGLLRQFLKSAIVDKDRGPIYLANLIKGTDENNLIGLLRTQANYFNQIALQESLRVNKLKEEMKKIKARGRNRDVKEYLSVLEDWRSESKIVDKYDYMSQLANIIADLYEKYYNKILKPLKDIIEELVIIFRENLEELIVRNAEYERNTDESLIITPFEFEKKYNDAHFKITFDACVNKAKGGFLDDMVKNLQYWIKCDIDNVDNVIVNKPDIPGFLSKFISDCFSTLYNTINMESVLSIYVPAGKTMVQYAEEEIGKMYNSAYPLFKNNSFSFRTDDFAIISIPVACPNILQGAQNFIANLESGEVQVKVSAERNSISIVKVTAGFPLYSMAYMCDWQNSYQRLISGDTKKNLHIIEDWGDALPEPNIEISWNSGYSIQGVQERNKDLRDKFYRCYKEGVIVYNHGDSHASLRIANPLVNLSTFELKGDLRQRKESLTNVRSQLWNDKNKIEKLEKQGVFANNGTDEGNIKNICENSIRDPKVWKMLDEQCQILDCLGEYDSEINDPYVFVRALMCDMIERKVGSSDIILKASSTAEVSTYLVRGTEFYFTPNDPEYYYEVYKLFRTKIMAITSSEMTWKQIVDANWATLMNKTVDSEYKKAVNSKLANFAIKFRDYAAGYSKQTKMVSVNEMSKKKQLMDMSDFYYIAYQVVSIFHRQINS